MVPTGFRFSPTDEELIEILNQKVSGNTIAMAPWDFIVERNIYDLEPQDLQWTESVGLNKNERYYYCKRERDSREVMGRGWWKATSHVKTIFANGGVVGNKRPLTFHRFRDHNNQRNRKDAIKTDWIMHEYGLESIPTEWRLCKIKYKGKEGLKEDMENIRTRNPMSSEAGDSSSSMNSMQLEFPFEQQQPPLPPPPQQQQPPLPPPPQQQQPLLQLPPVNNDYERYFWSNSSNMRIFDERQQLELAQPSSSFDLSSWMPILTPNYDDHFDQQGKQQPFPDQWP